MSGAGIPIPRPVTAADILLRLIGAATLAAGSFMVGQGTATLVSTGTGLTYASNTLTTRPAATQDGIALTGRAGGTSTYTQTLTTAALTGNRTATFPDAAIVVAGSAAALTSGRVPYVTTGGLLVDSANLTWNGSALSATSITAVTTLNVGTGTSGDGLSISHSTGQTPIALIAGGLPTSGSRLGLCFSGGATNNNLNRYALTVWALENWVSAGASGCELRIEVAAIGASTRTTALTIAAASVTSSVPLICSSTTDATTTSDGSVRLSGGLSVAAGKSIFCGGNITLNGTRLIMNAGVGASDSCRIQTTNTNAAGGADFFCFNDTGGFAGFQIFGGSYTGTFAGISNANLCKFVTSATNGMAFGTSSNTTVSMVANSTVRFAVNNTGVGFFGATPVARPSMAAATGTATRTSFATGSVTLAALAEAVKAIIDDLRGYGLQA
jgi:uncharacterized protein YjeT (DUF2065 family)